MILMRLSMCLSDRQSVARCVIVMNRYNAFMHALIVLQARWRGYQGRRIAIAARKRKSAITIQRHIRGFVQRCVCCSVLCFVLGSCRIPASRSCPSHVRRVLWLPLPLTQTGSSSSAFARAR